MDGVAREFLWFSNFLPGRSVPQPNLDDAAVKTLFERYVARLTALARSRLSSSLKRRLDPEDIVLSAFRSFFVGARLGRWNAESDEDMWSLLAMLTLRKLARQSRRHRSEKRSIMRETNAPAGWSALARDVPTAEEAAQLTDELEWLVETATGLDREVLLLQLRGDDVAEIARTLEISERTVRRSQQRTRESVTEDRRHAKLAATVAGCSAKERPVAQNRVTAGAVQPYPTRSLDELRLHEMLGQGAFSKVFRATDRKLGQIVAVKFLKKASWSDPRAIASYLREFESLSQLSHPNVLPVYGWGRTTRGAVFLVCEWIEGESLAGWQSERRPIRDVTRIGREIAAGLIAAHAAGIWHCDVKPGNVLLDRMDHCRLVDFGMARWGADDDSPHGGTAGFLAPEQVSPAFGAISERTDVYGLGATLYALLAGQAPCFGSDLPSTIVQVLSSDRAVDLQSLGIPPAVSSVVMRAVEKSSNHRWSSIAAMAGELHQVVFDSGETK